MRGFGRYLAIGALSFVVTHATQARAQELKPFTVVKEFCPECPRNDLDKIKLKGGQTVLAVVVGDNSAFYVLEKYGELRAVGRDKVDSIERSSTASRETGHEDQILLKDGKVFSGKIVKERETNGLFEIQVPPHKIILRAYKPVIASVFKAGKQYYPPAP